MKINGKSNRKTKERSVFIDRLNLQKNKLFNNRTLVIFNNNFRTPDPISGYQLVTFFMSQI